MAGTVSKAIIGRKLGMTQMFDDEGALEAVTAIEAGPCFVVQKKTKGKDGYDAVQLGFGGTKRCNSPEKGHLKAAGRELRYLNEFRLDDTGLFEVGQALDASLFEKGEKVDVVGSRTATVPPAQWAVPHPQGGCTRGRVWRGTWGTPG
jgi:large subunit ribosomal protein L3